MKRIILTVIMAVIILQLFTGCTAQTNGIVKTDEKIKIGICFSDFNDKFLSYILDEIKDNSKSLNNAEIEYADAKKDSNIQLKQVESFIAEGVDVIAINPVDNDSTDPMREKAKEAGIPIISFNDNFENENDATCVINSNAKQSGMLEMEYLAKKANYEGNIAIIMGTINDGAQRLRTQAFHEVIAKYPDMNIIAEQSADWNRAKGRALMEGWLESEKDINIVACENDEMAIGASMAIEEAGKLGKITVGGIDATPDALNYLKIGKLDVTVFPNGSGQSQAILDTAVKLAKGEKVEKTISFENELVTSESADTYIAKWKN